MLDDLKLHHAFRQQFQCPPRPAVGLGAAGDGDEFGFVFAVEDPLDAGSDLLLAVQCGVQPLLGQPPAQRLDGPHTRAERVCGFDVFHPPTVVGLVHRQQNVGVANPRRRAIADPHQSPEPATLFGSKPHTILLHDDPS